VLNNTKVHPWRFFARQIGSDREIELLILRRESTVGSSERWSALARPMRKLKAGDTLELGTNAAVTVVGRSADGNELIIERHAGDPFPDGSMPIPPYIRGGRGDSSDRESYQTVYAAVEGSIAAPTAGLHFTPELLSSLTARGISQSFITLHLGAASFLPVRDELLSHHQMTEEYYSIPERTRSAIDQTKSRGGRIVAVGTSTVRALESAAIDESMTDTACLPRAGQREFHGTRIFITPGFRFQVVDAVITNFHQPGSTHLLLVAALLGKRLTAECYQHALAGHYRFLSYGDAMLIE
jgi:S-adenosylmethionine:tRNA ribosyltransferase-isomerase